MICLVGLELGCAQNLLHALGIPCSVTYCAAPRPLVHTDSVRVIRQTEEGGKQILLAGAFQETAVRQPE